MLTFDSIRDVERAEKDSKKLQKLPEDFFDQLADYFIRKNSMSDKASADIIEMENVKNVIKRLIDLREKKLVEMALINARTGTLPENLTKNEQQIFQGIVGNIKNLRNSIFSCFDGSKIPRYRAIKDIPKFVGPDMKTYEFAEGQIVDVPQQINDFLLKEGFIEEMVWA